jgi:hypothetical protein
MIFTPANYKQIRPLIKTGDVVAFGGTKDLVGIGIRVFTVSLHHHIAIVLRTEEDRVVLMESSANYGGVKGVGRTFLSKRIDETNGLVDILSLSPDARAKFDADKCAEFLLSVEGRPYDTWGAGLSGFGQWLRIPGRTRYNALFCSELADAGHVAGGLVVGRDRTPTPREIVERRIYHVAWRVKPEPNPVKQSAPNEAPNINKLLELVAR